MDAEQFRLLGFSCQSKPQVCRKCGEELVVGKNWQKSLVSRKEYSCSACVSERCERWRKENPQRQKDYEYRSSRNVRFRYGHGRVLANRKGIPWTITREEYYDLMNKPCHYCGHELRNTGVALDQVVPSEGYTMENVVPCCHECNVAKHDHFTYEEMLLIGKVIKEIKEKRKISKDFA